MAKIIVVDGFEENYAICENRRSKKIIQIDISNLPEGTKEGTVLRLCRGKLYIDTRLQNKIQDRIQSKMNDIWED